MVAASDAADVDDEKVMHAMRTKNLVKWEIVLMIKMVLKGGRRAFASVCFSSATN